MSGAKEAMKQRWNNRERLRGERLGVNKVSGLMGKAKGTPTEVEDRRAVPLSSLKDPATFGPPPKHAYRSGETAGPNATATDRVGRREPLPRSTIRAQQDAGTATAGAEETEPTPPPMPYRANTTGISTESLPKPPLRRPTADPPNLGRINSPPTASSNKPQLPPRLPPRQSSNAGSSGSPPPPSYDAATSNQNAETGYLNQGAASRLGRSGISVPGLDIGTHPSQNGTASGRDVASPSGGRKPQLNELQSRFSKLSSLSSNPDPSSEGTSLAQKKAALRSAGSFRNDPSSVSLSEARDAASTANNFRQRHGAEVAQGVKTANGLNQKYGLAERMSNASGLPGGSPTNLSPVSPSPPLVAGKKPPPPPLPPKKKNLNAAATDAPCSPPPIPLGSKPKP
ncbi:MAG: hypothetical protein M1837_006962 [Sclerophora amabilis]|nr:MAG: hypothetical protein M1837_006962 [Sclerophora amabilis]